VGHILFSDLHVEVDGRRISAVALAPLAVAPESQNRGIGAQLVEAGIAEMREGGVEAIIVLGHPDYYRRFGFSNEAIEHIASPFSGNEAFMGLELVRGILAGGFGRCRYPAVFGIPDD
jgi:putative acetyltransferase